MFWKNGNKYEGKFVNDQMEGYGVMTYSKDSPNGESQHIGYYKENKKHGNGVFLWTDGTKYVGNFEDDLINGFGTNHFNKEDSRERYEGNFEKEKFQGQGKMFWKNGDFYFGSFANNQPLGEITKAADN